MLGNLALPEVSRNQPITHMQFEYLTHILIGYRVEVMALLDVVVDIDPHSFDVHVLIGVAGEC